MTGTLVERIGSELHIGRGDNYRGARLTVRFSLLLTNLVLFEFDHIYPYRQIAASRTAKKGLLDMNRNFLYLIIGALAVVAVVLGYDFYQEHQRTTGIQIDVNKNGLSIEKN
jgi:hypothetical protein